MNTKALQMNMRERRADLFANQIFSTLRDFLPSDGSVVRSVLAHLKETAYEASALIVTVPPEYDYLTKMEAEQAMIKKMMEPVIVNITRP